jgi:hypothetical protein
VRAKKPVAARRRLPPVKAPAQVGGAEDAGVEEEVLEAVPEVAASGGSGTGTPASAARRPTGGATRRKGRGE